MTEPLPASTETPSGRRRDTRPAHEKQLTIRYTADLTRADVEACAAEAHLAPATWVRVVVAEEISRRRANRIAGDRGVNGPSPA